MSGGRRTAVGFLLLTASLFALALLNLMIGSVRIAPGEVLSILLGGLSESAELSNRIIWTIRLPRLLAAALLGGGLAVSGVLLQVFFANPIAGPFVLGISSGAKLSVALAMIWALGAGRTLGNLGLILAALAGAMIAMGFILLVSEAVHKLAYLIICGVMIGYICSAITDVVVTFADDSNIVNLHNWSLGSFSGIGWGDIGAIAIVISLAFLSACLLTKPIAAYQLGETYAASMGVKIRPFRIQLILISSLLAACVTAYAGPVSFVGIAVPHLIRSLFHTAKPHVILPGSFLGGAAFCLFSDLVARSAFAPTELGIGTVTAIFGAPVVIWMLLRKSRPKA